MAKENTGRQKGDRREGDNGDWGGKRERGEREMQGDMRGVAEGDRGMWGD